MPEERVFSEQEVSDIIRRAVQLTESSTPKNYTPGVTKAELERIAVEVGVSPEALQRAILEAGEKKGNKGFLNLTREFERVVEGELDPGSFDILTEGIKPIGNVGQPTVAQVGRSMSMSAWTGVGQAKVDVTSRNGRTRLKVKSNAFFQFMMAFYPGLIGTILTATQLAEKGQALLGGILATVIFTVASLIFALLVSLGHKKAEKLADDMRNRIAESVAEQEAQFNIAQAKAEDEPLPQRLDAR